MYNSLFPYRPKKASSIVVRPLRDGYRGTDDDVYARIEPTGSAEVLIELFDKDGNPCSGRPLNITAYPDETSKNYVYTNRQGRAYTEISGGTVYGGTGLVGTGVVDATGEVHVIDYYSGLIGSMGVTLQRTVIPTPPPWSPADDAYEWWRADLGITLRDSAHVEQWEGQVRGVQLVQATEGNQPSYISSDSDFNDEPSIDFSRFNGDTLNADTPFTLYSPYTFAMVVQMSSNFNNSFLIRCEGDTYGYNEQFQVELEYAGSTYQSLRFGGTLHDSGAPSMPSEAIALVFKCQESTPDPARDSIPGFVHHYPLISDINDAVGSAHGTWINPGGTGGNFVTSLWPDGCLYVDGSSGMKRPQLPIPASVFTSNSGDFTISWWAYTETDPSPLVPHLIRGESSGGASMIRVELLTGTTRPRIRYMGTTGGSLQNWQPKGEPWHFTYRRSGSTCYLIAKSSGYDDDTYLISATDLSTAMNLCLGGNNSDELANFTGYIWDVRVFDRAISVAEIESLYKGGGDRTGLWLNGGSNAVIPPSNQLYSVINYNLAIGDLVNAWDGYIAELAIFDGFDIDTINTWGDYVADRYGVPWTEATV